jgi:hypothetical protein
MLSVHLFSKLVLIDTSTPFCNLTNTMMLHYIDEMVGKFCEMVAKCGCTCLHNTREASNLNLQLFSLVCSSCADHALHTNVLIFVVFSH